MLMCVALTVCQVVFEALECLVKASLPGQFFSLSLSLALDFFLYFYFHFNFPNECISNDIRG